MGEIARFISNYFNVNMLILFLVSAMFLLFFDSRQYKSDELKREYKFSKTLGLVYVIGGIAVFIFARLIR